MNDDQTNIDLIRRAAGGDPLAQEQFVSDHCALLLRYLQHRIPENLRRLIDPQDVLQDVCFEAFRRMDRFKAEDPRMAVRWLLRIARNRVIDLIRKEHTVKRGGGRVAPLQQPDSDDDTVLQLLQELAVYRRTPSQSAIRHELLISLERGIERLTPDHRQALQCRYVDNLPIEQIAQRMHRSDGAVLMLCNRALKALRVELGSISRYI